MIFNNPTKINNKNNHISQLVIWVHLVEWVSECYLTPIQLFHGENSPRVDISLHRTHYSDSEPSSLFTLMLRAYRKSNKYQFYHLWFDPTVTRSHDLPHSKRARSNHYATDAVAFCWMLLEFFLMSIGR